MPLQLDKWRFLCVLRIHIDDYITLNVEKQLCKKPILPLVASISYMEEILLISNQLNLVQIFTQFSLFPLLLCAFNYSQPINLDRYWKMSHTLIVVFFNLRFYIQKVLSDFAKFIVNLNIDLKELSVHFQA